MPVGEGRLPANEAVYPISGRRLAGATVRRRIP
jgi:hypothetical protein